MPIQNRKENPPIAFLVLLIIIFDQTAKSLLKKALPIGRSLPVIKNVFHLTYVQNFGAAFGIFKKGSVFFIIVSSFAIIFILSMFFYERDLKFTKNLRLRTALAMILGGAVGNFIDRVRFGYVIDFIDVRIWPVFNIADTFITIGAFLLIYELIRG